MERVKLVNKKLKPLAIGFFFICLLVTMVFSFYSMPTVKADNTNLAPFPSGWVDDHTWNNVPYGAVQHETSITHGGAYTLKIVPSVSVNSFDAFDFWVVSAPVGSRVVISVWVKTLGSGYVWLNGAFLGLDYYSVGQKRIAGMNCLADAVSGVGWSPFHSGGGDVDAGMVHWGTDWTQITWDFVVPSLVEGDGLLSGQVPANQFVAPAYFCPWLEVVSSNYPSDAYTAYFSDMQIYVNPSGVSTPSPSPVPSASPTASPNPSASPTATPTITPSPTIPPSSNNFVITKNPFTLNFSAGQSFSIQSLSPDSTITFTVTSGTLVGIGSVNASNVGGIFQILPTTSGTFIITTSGTSSAQIFIDGAYANNIPFTFSPGDPIITWTYGYGPISSPTPTPIYIQGGTNTILFFRSDTITFNNYTAYQLANTATNALRSVNDTVVNPSNTPVYGFRVWLVHYDGSYVELTSGSPVALINPLTSTKNATWTPSQTTVAMGYDVLEVQVYLLSDTNWVSRASFITQPIMSNTLLRQTWNFNLNCQATNSSNTYTTGFSFGDKNSFISNVGFAKPSNFDLQGAAFALGNILLFIFIPYVYIFGPAAYLLCLFIPTFSLYARYRDSAPLIFFYVIFSATIGASIWLFIPQWAAGVIDAILLLLFAALIWRAIR